MATLIVLFLTSIELGFAMALVGFVGFGTIVSYATAMNLLAKDIYDVFASYGFAVVPLFILMGQVAYNAGIAKRLYDSSYKFVGHIPGGLALATVAVPEMDRYGYDWCSARPSSSSSRSSPPC